MTIRRLERQDLYTRVVWMNNPKVYSTMHFEVPIHYDNTCKWFDNNLYNSKRVDLVCVKDGQLIAMGGLTGICHEVGKAELYVFVNPEMQKSGMGTIATRLICKYGFETLALNKIFLETNEDNTPARRVYEKCGFKLEGELRCEYLSSDGLLKSRMYYGLLKGELNEY